MFRSNVRHAIAWGLLAAVLASLFALTTVHQIPPASDVWDYSQEARQMARGEGFTSLYTYPAHLGANTPPFPVSWRMPLFAALGALLLKIHIPLPVGYFVVAIVAHALLVALLFLLAAHLHSNRAGAIAAAAAIASPLLLDPYSAGLSQVPAAAFALGVWLLLLRGCGLITALLAATLAALTWYMRFESVLMVPVWLWAAARGARARFLRPAAFLAVYAVLCLPWVLANQRSFVQGNPMLLYTPEFPGYTSMRAYGVRIPDVPTYVLQHPTTFLVRFIKDAAGYGIDLLWGLGSLTVGLAIAGLLLREPKAGWRSLQPALPLLAGAAIQIAAFSCLERSPRFLVPAVALVSVALGIVAAPALDRICGRRMGVALFALIILERAATVAFETREAARRAPPIPESLAQDLKSKLAGTPPAPQAPHTNAESERRAAGAPHAPRPQSLLWSDIPDWVAWYLDRPALMLPRWGQRLHVSADHPVAGVFLSPAARDRNLADGEAEWVRVIEREDSVPGFRGPERLPAHALLYLPAR